MVRISKPLYKWRMSVRLLINKYYHISTNNVLNDVIIDQLNHTYQERKMGMDKLIPPKNCHQNRTTKDKTHSWAVSTIIATRLLLGF